MRPDVRTYADYRAFLRAFVAYLRETQRGFSFRQFSRKAGFRSPNFLKLVADGQRNLSDESVAKFGQALGLTHIEQVVFDALVRFGQAKTDRLRNQHYTQLRQLVPKTPATVLERAQFDVYSTWYALAVLEMFGLPGFRVAADWIGARLSPPVPAARIERALGLLTRVGLLKETRGALTPAESKRTTHEQVLSLAVRNYHRLMLRLAQRALDHFTVERRYVTSLTVAMSPAQYARVCERLGQLRQDLLDELETDPTSVGREVYSIGLHAFPLTEKST